MVSLSDLSAEEAELIQRRRQALTRVPRWANPSEQRAAQDETIDRMRLEARQRLLAHRKRKRADTCPMCGQKYDPVADAPHVRAGMPPIEQRKQIEGDGAVYSWSLKFADGGSEIVEAATVGDALRAAQGRVVSTIRPLNAPLPPDEASDDSSP